MKITTVLTAVNNNPKYTKFIPIFVNQWKKMYPEIKIKIVYIGPEIPEELKDYTSYIDIFPEIPNISSVYIAQTIRILYPALIENEMTIITDIDMIPANKEYFSRELDENAFTIFRPLNCVGQGEIAICYNAASTNIWKDIFKVKNLEDIRDFLIKKYRYSDGKHGGNGWNMDQIILFNNVMSWNGSKIILGDSNFKRLDYYHHKYDKNIFKEMLNSELYSDAHLYADLCTWTDI